MHHTPKYKKYVTFSHRCPSKHLDSNGGELMKKRSVVFVAMFFLIIGGILGGILGYNLSDDENDNKQPVLPSERAIALKIATESMSENDKDSLVPGDVPTIQKVASYKPWDQKKAIQSDHLYKVSFRTTKDAMLGPLVMYVDTESQAILGYDIRH